MFFIVQLFNEQKYEPAKMCFERAGEAFLAKWADASGLRAAAWNISTSNSDVAGMYLKNAATIFNSIGKFEAAAKCFYESKEYNLAGIFFYFSGQIFSFHTVQSISLPIHL